MSVAENVNVTVSRAVARAASESLIQRGTITLFLVAILLSDEQVISFHYFRFALGAETMLAQIRFNSVHKAVLLYSHQLKVRKKERRKVEKKGMQEEKKLIKGKRIKERYKEGRKKNEGRKKRGKERNEGRKGMMEGE